MTTLQLSADIQRSLEQIEGDENLMQRAANYLRRLAKKREDPTLMTREEFFKQVDEALEQAERGEGKEWLPGETYQQFKNRIACTR